MARQTIAEIVGEYGLSQNATFDPFAKTEKSVYDSVNRALEEVRSSEMESAVGRGMGRSSFTQGNINRREADVMGGVSSQLASNRMNFDVSTITDALKSNLQQDVLGTQSSLESDLYKDKSNFEAQKNLQALVNNFLVNMGLNGFDDWVGGLNNLGGGLGGGTTGDDIYSWG